MSIREIFTTRVMEAGGRLKVRTAINSMLWLCGIITTPCLLVYGVKPSASDWLLVCALAPEAAAIFGFIFLLFFDRPYLQSEDFQIRKLEIEMIEEKGKPSIEAASVEGLVLQAEDVPQIPGEVGKNE